MLGGRAHSCMCACPISRQPTPIVADGLTRACRQRQWLRPVSRSHYAAATGAAQLQQWLAPQQQGLRALRRVPWVQRRSVQCASRQQRVQHPAARKRAQLVT